MQSRLQPVCVASILDSQRPGPAEAGTTYERADAQGRLGLTFGLASSTDHGQDPTVPSREQIRASPPLGFATTHWSVVLAARGNDSQAAQAALEQLCRAYWYPVYAYVRRSGHRPEDAQDLTQSFFGQMLAGNWIARADPAKGKFRTFLLSGIRNFLLNDWQKAQRAKRGGGCPIIELDGLEAEDRYRVEPAEVNSPDKLFERRWALTLLERVLGRLRAEQSESGAVRFSLLQPALIGEPSADSYAALANQCAVSESTVKSWVFRLRRRYRRLLRDEVSRTVETQAAVDDELKYLFRVLSGP